MLAIVLPLLANAQVYIGGTDVQSGAVLLSNVAETPAPQPGSDAVSPPRTNADQSPLLRQNDAAQRQASKATHSIDLRQLIAQVARDSGVGADLIAAVAAAESRFDPTARSPKGAIGLMQLMPATAERFGVQDIWAVEDNLRGGAAYLRWLLDLFGGDISLAVAAYNAGEHAVLKAGRRIPAFGETLSYVPRVLAWREHYAFEFGQPESATHAARAKHPLPNSRKSNATGRQVTLTSVSDESGHALAGR
jgi:soluble lytic murein transglycosylase-like protein